MEFIFLLRKSIGFGKYNYFNLVKTLMHERSHINLYGVQHIGNKIKKTFREDGHEYDNDL